MLERLKEKINNIGHSSRIIGVLAAILLFVAASLLIFGKMENLSARAVKKSYNEPVNLRINEYVVRNQNTYRDGNWNSPDWIEIFNYGDTDIWLGDIYLSDDIQEPDKYLLPDTYLKSGECILVLASGENNIDDDNLRAPFKLGKDDEEILLFKDSDIIDYLEIAYLPTDISAGYDLNGNFGYFSQPTPGTSNTTKLYDTFSLEPYNPYDGMVLINEYVLDNTYGLKDSEGNYCDWIEVYNPGDEPVKLGDIFISDDENELNKYRLPDIELESGGYVLIYASGEIIESGNEIHVPFSLSTEDDNLILTHASGRIICQVEVCEMGEDVSYGLNREEHYVFFAEPTPLSENTTAYFISNDIKANYNTISELIINEWMSDNDFSILDEDGDTSDWVEIYNPLDEEVSLEGFALTDDAAQPFKWQFPDSASISAEGYLIVYLSGKDKVDSNNLHSNFSLSEGETLYLIEPSAAVCDSVEIEDLPGNVSKGTTENGYGYYSLPTPGNQNATEYDIDINNDLDFITGDLYISEVSSSGYHELRYKSRPLYEFIELYNCGMSSVSLKGYTLYLESGESFRFEEDIDIGAGKFLLMSIKGYTQDSKNTITADSLSLDSSGEAIFLVNPEGIIIDYFETGYLLGSYSSGRMGKTDGSRVFFMEKTPGRKNSDEVYTSYAAKPIFSKEGGVVEDESIVLEISSDESATIYYTLDGNIPTENSDIYNEPIVIENDTVVRAVAVVEGKLPSIINTATYIMEREHDVPVVCLATPPGGFFYEGGGIYANGEGYGQGEYPYFEANYFKDIERKVSFEYYDESGKKAVGFDAGIQIAGGYTRALDQKSLVIRLRDEYGLDELEYQFFDEGTDVFKHLLLRNGGQEGWKTKIADCFIQNCANELGTIDTKRGRPVAVYINGQYWGLYNLRDKLNDEYLSIKYSIKEDDISILTEYSSPKKGSNEEWLELEEYCRTHNMSVKENYEYLAARVDVESFMDYMIVETFFGNVDTHNINFWKSEEEGSKWRPLLFDMDLSLRDVDYSIVNMYLGRSDLGFDSFVIKSLIKYEGFRQDFLNRYSYILNYVFTEEYLVSELQALENEIQNEIVYHIERWGRPASVEYWQQSMDYLKTMAAQRRYDVVEELAEFFDLSPDQVGQLFQWYQ